MTRILVTLDGSRESEAILQRVAPLASDAGAGVTLLTVVEPPPTQVSTSGPAEADRWQALRVELSAGSGQFGGPATSSWPREQESAHESRGQTLDRARDRAQHYLDDKAEPLRNAGIGVDTAVLLEESAAQAIIDYATEHKPDLIAMSTHGRSGLNEADPRQRRGRGHQVRRRPCPGASARLNLRPPRPGLSEAAHARRPRGP